MSEKITENKAEKEDPPLWSLVPRVLKKEEDIMRVQPYLNSLKKGIEEERIRNIGLTGDYGSGKSTVLLTFQDKNPNYEYLNISLASFKEEEEEAEIKKLSEEELKDVNKQEGNTNKIAEKFDSAKKDEKINHFIEISILQQIIYQANPKDIPDSRFQRIIGLSNKDLFNFALGCVLWFISFLIMFKFDGLNKVNPTNWTYRFSDLSMSTLLAVPFFCSE